jgi:hypothetical protein
MGRFGFSEHSKCVARVRGPVMDRFVYRETRRSGSDRAIVAKRLKAALAGRGAEGEPGQDLAKPVDADPDIVCLRHRLAIL